MKKTVLASQAVEAIATMILLCSQRADLRASRLGCYNDEISSTHMRRTIKADENNNERYPNVCVVA